MSEFDINPHIFRQDAVPETNEGAALGRVGRRWSVIRAASVVADSITALVINVAAFIVTALTVTTSATLSFLTSGSVLFAGAGGLISQDNANFAYDPATHTLTLGTNPPAASAPLALSVPATQTLLLFASQNPDGGGPRFATVSWDGGTGNFLIGTTSGKGFEVLTNSAPRIRVSGTGVVSILNLSDGIVVSDSAGALSVQSSQPMLLTNKTGGTLAAGDVVTFDSTNDSAVALDDTVWSIRPFVVALEAINNNASGHFGFDGRVVTVKVTGAVTRGNYLIKSATAKTAQDSGLGQATAGRGRVYGGLGIALTADSGGFCAALWFGSPASSGVMAASLGETTTATGGAVDLVTFSGLNIPATSTWSLYGLSRKSAGAASAATLGVKVNGSQVWANGAATSAANQAEDGSFLAGQSAPNGARAANYTHGLVNSLVQAFISATGVRVVNSNMATDYTNPLPTGAITSVAVTGSSVSAAQTLGVANVLLTVTSN